MQQHGDENTPFRVVEDPGEQKSRTQRVQECNELFAPSDDEREMPDGMQYAQDQAGREGRVALQEARQGEAAEARLLTERNREETEQVYGDNLRPFRKLEVGRQPAA